MLLFLKGIIVGLGKIIPGVSGAMLAINLNLYEKLIIAITHFFDDFKNNFKFLLVFGLGLVSAIIFGSKLIIFLLSSYRFITMCFFIGLVSGGLYIFSMKIKYTNETILFICIGLLILLFFNAKFSFHISSSFNKNILFFCGGYIEIFASLVPGISATSLLMALDIYDYVLDMISNIYNIDYVIDHLSLYLFYGIGMFLSFIINLYLINYLLKKYKNTTYIVILCFAIFSIILLLINIFKIQYSLLDVVIGLILFWFGFLLSEKLS